MSKQQRRWAHRACYTAAVHIVDPRTVLDPQQGPQLSGVQLEVPQSLLREAPHFELGEADDPMSTWVFGKRAEIFQYKYIGAIEHFTAQHSAAKVTGDTLYISA